MFECKGCEILQRQLDIANNEKKELLDTILSLVRPEVIPPTPVKQQKSFAAAAVPWATKRRMLEQADAEKAKAQAEMARVDKEIEEMKQRQEAEAELKSADNIN